MLVSSQTSLGYLSGGEDHFSQVQRGNIFGQTGVDLYRTDRPAYGENGTYGAYIYNAELQRIISEYSRAPEQEGGGKPLFIYCALQDQHAPNQVTPEFQALISSNTYTSQYAIYNGMGSAADSVFGNATRSLKQHGLWENTLVIMSSDK
jgi:arylsulfatase A-like enzyme